MPRNVSVSFEDGTVHTYQNVPDTAMPEDIEARAQRDFQGKRAVNIAREPIATTPSGGVGTELKRGARSFASTVQTAAEATFGDKEKALEAARLRQEAISKDYGESPGWEATKKAYQEKGLLPAAGEFISQIPGAVAEQAPQIAATTASGAAGAAVAGPAGALAGITAPAYTQAYGALIEREAAEQRARGEKVDPSLASAALLAVPYAAADVAGTYLPMGKGIIKSLFGEGVSKLLSRGMTKEAEAIAQQKLDKEGFLKAATKGTAKGVAFEIPTEIGQQMLERTNAGLPLFSEDALTEYGQTAYAVFRLGPIGGAGRLVDRSGAQAAVKKQEAEQRRAETEAAAKAEAERKSSPEYLFALEDRYKSLDAQYKEARAAIPKLPKDATETEKEARQEAIDAANALLRERKDLGAEYRPLQQKIATLRETQRVEAMSPQDYYYEQMGMPSTKEVEAVTPPAAPVDEMQQWLEQTRTQAAPAAQVEPKDEVQARAEKLMGGVFHNAQIIPMSETEIRNDAVEVLMRNPALAQRMVDEQIAVPGFSARDSKTILGSLKLNLKGLPEQTLEEEKSALLRMGEEKRLADAEKAKAEQLAAEDITVRETKQRLKNTIEGLETASSDRDVNYMLNKLVDELKKQEAPAPVASNVPMGAGAVSARNVGVRAEDLAELSALVDKYRMMEQQKGAARDNAAMADILEEIKALTKPFAEDVLPEDKFATADLLEKKTEGTYRKELDRLRQVQNESFQPAVEGLFQLEESRRKRGFPAIIGPTQKAFEADINNKVGTYVNAVLEEIEGNRRAASGPSLTTDEVKTLSGRINGILMAAARGKFGAPAQAQAVLREQIDEIRREASTFERKLQKAPTREMKLRYSEAGPEAPTELGPRREALVGRIENALDNERLQLPKDVQDTLQSALRMMEEGTGSKELIDSLEEQMSRYERGIETVRTDRDLFTPAITVPQGKTLQATARPEQRTVTTETTASEFMPEIRKQMALDKQVAAETEGQLDLFTPAVGESRIAEMKRNRADLLKRIEGRKGKKITREEFAQHREDIKEAQRLADEISVEEKAVKSLKPEAERMATATKRATPENFQKFLNSAVAERMRGGKRLTQLIVAEEKPAVDMQRALDVMTAHVDAMRNRMQTLSDEVAKQRKLAEAGGKRTNAFKEVQAAMANAEAQFAKDFARIGEYRATVMQYAAQRDSAHAASLKITGDMLKQAESLQTKLKDLKAANMVEGKFVPKDNRMKATVRGYEQQIGALYTDVKNTSEAFAKVTAPLDTTIKTMLRHVDNMLSWTPQGNAAEKAVLNEYMTNKPKVVNALAAAKDLREVLNNLITQRAEFVSKMADEKRAAEAIERGEVAGEAAARQAASEKAAAQKIGLGLPGIKVERQDLSIEIAEAKELVDTAKETLADLQAARKDATGREAASLTKQINTLTKTTIPTLEKDVQQLQAQKAKTTKLITVGKETAEKPLPPAKAAEAKTAFEGGFEEFKLARETRPGVLPYEATRTLQPPQLKTGAYKTAAQQAQAEKRTKQAFEEGIAAEKPAVSATDRLSLIKSIADRVQKRNGTVLRVGTAVTNPVDKASIQKYMMQVKEGLPENVKFHYSYELSGAPKEFLDALIADGVDLANPKEAIKGAVLSDGTVVIIGNQHTSQSDLELTIAHELVGHYGIDVLLGERGMKALLTSVERRAGGLLELARELGVEDRVQETITAYDTKIANAEARGDSVEDIAELKKEKRLTTLREMIARTAEKTFKETKLTSKLQQFLKELISLVRTGLLRMGFSDLVDAKTSDIYYMLRQSTASFADKTIGAYRSPTGEIAFRRESAEPGPKTPDALATFAKDNIAVAPTMFDRVFNSSTGLAFYQAAIDRYASLASAGRKTGLEESKFQQMMYFARIHDNRTSITASVVNNGAAKIVKDSKGNLMLGSTNGASLLKMMPLLRSVQEQGYGNATQVRDLFDAGLKAIRALRVGPEKLNFMRPATRAQLEQAVKQFNAIPEFVEARKIYNEFNRDQIQFAVDAGAMTKDLGRVLLKEEDYVPFYRMDKDDVFLEVGDQHSVKIGSLTTQPYLHALVGDDNKTKDFFSAAVQNTAMLVDMSLQNLAKRNVAFGLQDMGVLEGHYNPKTGKTKNIFKGNGPASKDVIRFKIEGEPHYAVVDTEAIGIPSQLLVQGLEGTVATVGTFVRMAAIPAKLLRTLITRLPLYPARQIIRDSTTNFLINGGNVTPLLSSLKEVKGMLTGVSEGERVLREQGVFGGQILSGTSEDMGKIMLQLTKGDVSALAKLDMMTMKADASSRVALYNSYIKQGLSEMEASLAAMESMNFTKRGTSGTLYALNMMVPFLNSQIQGLNALYEAMRGRLPYSKRLDIQKKIVQRGTLMVGATIAYAMMMEDDEAYKNAKMRERLSNFFVRVPGVDEPIRIPIPYEAGLIFKALPEALYLATKKDYDADEVFKELRKLAMNTTPIGPTTFIPQAVKPIIEAQINKSFYTGEDIESRRELGLIPEARVRAKTSDTARFIGETLGVSPIKVDYLTNAYFGGYGMALMHTLGMLVPSGGPEAPTKNMSDMPLVGSMFQPNNAAGQVDVFYEKAEEYAQIKATFEKYKAEGDLDKAQALADEYGQEIMLAKVASKRKEMLTKLNKIESLVRASDLSPAEKRQRIDEIRDAKEEFAKAFNEASRQ